MATTAQLKTQQRDLEARLASFAKAHHKAVVLPEWGLGWGACSKSGQPITAHGQVCGGDNATWIGLMANWITTHDVAEATYWDFETSAVGRVQATTAPCSAAPRCRGVHHDDANRYAPAA